MHRLQKYILDRLRLEQPLSYSDMLPKDVVSSHFQYHLKSLQNEGLIQKESRGQYLLTHAGQAALEYMSMGRDTPVRMPKVITYTLLTHGDQLLLLRKQKEPYRNCLEPVAGKIHFGEDASDAAQRELYEKIGLHTQRPTLRGTANMLITKDGEPLTHMTVYAHTLELTELPAPMPNNMVMVPKSSIEAQKDLVPGTLQLIRALLQNRQEPFVLDIQAEF
ncbi:MAG TPA: NUDIX domain-containing protein [Candidatus Saccharimonadales bacterium]|nr:NUDIX domain-containing protein [Candidatus Saccharimonadales bacterium]